MKYLILLFPIFLYATNWNYRVLKNQGAIVEIICKNGYLTEKVTFQKPKGSVEQQYCYDYSTWNGGCNHPPIKCEIKNNEQ